MDLLCFTTITSLGVSKEIEFPLHPETQSPEVISKIVTELLNTISECVSKVEDCKDGDILQALSMVLAIRSRMVDIDPNNSNQLLQQLVAMHHQAVVEAKEQLASRA
ncbi:MAG: hypothetical protein AAF304_08490 [Pseudomonadota bacterium]